MCVPKIAVKCPQHQEQPVLADLFQVRCPDRDLVELGMDQPQDPGNHHRRQRHRHDQPGRPPPVVGDENRIGEDDRQHPEHAALDRGGQPSGLSSRTPRSITTYWAAMKKTTMSANSTTSNDRSWRSVGCHWLDRARQADEQQAEHHPVKQDRQRFEAVQDQRPGRRTARSRRRGPSTPPAASAARASASRAASGAPLPSITRLLGANESGAATAAPIRSSGESSSIVAWGSVMRRPRNWPQVNGRSLVRTGFVKEHIEPRRLAGPCRQRELAVHGPEEFPVYQLCLHQGRSSPRASSRPGRLRSGSGPACRVEERARSTCLSLTTRAPPTPFAGQKESLLMTSPPSRVISALTSSGGSSSSSNAPIRRRTPP